MVWRPVQLISVIIIVRASCHHGFYEGIKTNSVTGVNEYQEAFGFDPVRRQIIKSKINFLVKICKNINSIGASTK